MRILLSAYSCSPNRGSELGNGWNWAIELSKSAERVFCYTRSTHKTIILEELKRLGITNLSFVFVDPPAVFEKNYNTNKVGLYMHYISWQWYAHKKAKAMKEKHAYTIVHHVTYASLQLGSYMYKLNLPFIFGPIGGGQFAPVKFKSYFGRYWKEEIARKITSNILVALNPGTKRSLKKATTVLASNPETKQLAKEIGARHIELFFDTGLPLSFYPKALPLSTYSDVLEILWVGRLLPRKGLKLVLESLALVKSEINFKLTIVGDGEMGVYLSEWLIDLDLQDRIEWLGQIPFAQVKEQYLKSHLFLFTSLRDSCPAQLLEAMAYGLPIITLDLHGASIAVPDEAGIKIEPTNPEQTRNDIAKAVKYLSQNPDKLKELGENGYKYALEQTWEKKVRHIFETVY